MKPLFIASNFKNDLQKSISSTFNREDKSVDDFGANVTALNDKELLNSMNQNLTELCHNKEILNINRCCKNNIDDNFLSKPEVIDWKSRQIKMYQEEKLNNSDLSSQKSKQKDYSERKDVVVKSIFRAIKKYYLEEFKNYWNQNSIVINKKDKRDSFSKMWDFVEKLFALDGSNWVFHNLDKALLTSYIGRISLPDYVMKTTGGYIANKEVGLFYEWVYKYSRAKASQLFTSVPIQAMFSHFISSGGLQKMINKDKNLQRNKDNVIEKANELYRWLKTVNQTS